MIKEIFRTFFKMQSSPADKVTDFSEAYEWILTYQKSEEYENAIMAARELLLKIKTGITYFDSAERKVAVLASSNIANITKTAQEKSKIIKKQLKNLYKWELQLRKLIEKCEVLKAKKDAKDAENQVSTSIKVEIAVIDEAIKQNEHVQALHIAKKLASTHYNSKLASDTLIRVQGLHDKRFSSKAEDAETLKKRFDRFFREAGIKHTTIEAVKAERPKVSFKDTFAQIFSVITKKQTERKEYMKRQKALRNIEKLLLDTGSITKIKDADGDAELFSEMTSGLSKDISNFKINGYDFFGKILGKDKIVGDTFGFFEEGNRTVFYFGDATGHGVQAGFTVSLLSKIFFEQTKKVKNFLELFRAINNELKEKLKGRVFVTGVCFEHDSKTGKLNFIGAGHDPMYIYHKSTREVEKVIPGGLALGVRSINNVSSIKLREFDLQDGDILIGYTDGIIEARNMKNELYGLSRLETAIRSKYSDASGDPTVLYDLIIKDVKEFMGENVFLDDVSMFLFKRDPSKDLITEKHELDKLLAELDTSQNTVKIDYRGKTRAEVIGIMQQEKHKAELKARLTNLEQLYKL